MRPLFFVILIFCASSLFAQQLFGIKVGPSLTSASSDNFNDKEMRAGITAGVTYDHYLTKRFSLGADLLYAQRGFLDHGVITYADYTGISRSNVDTKFNFDYVSLPLKAALHFGDRLSGFGSVGLVPSYLIKLKTEFHVFAYNPSYDTFVTINDTEKATRFDFAGLFELGGNYKVSDQIWFYSSFAFQHSFTSVTNKDYYSKSTIRNFGMTLSIGVKYVLKG